MIKKFPYPIGGLLILPDDTRWYIGQMSGWRNSKEICKHFFLQKGESCDRHKANACHKRAMFYGYEKIGPRVYALYRCRDHGMIRVRLMPAEGPEIKEYLQRQ